MVTKVRIEHGNHDWEKVNLVTISGRNGGYDKMKCKLCGITGKRYHPSFIEFPNTLSVYKINKCSGHFGVLKIKVIQCTAQGKAFANLTPDSIHEVIDPPAGENDKKGLWVMGNGEPVLLLFGEFQQCK